MSLPSKARLPRASRKACGNSSPPRTGMACGSGTSACLPPAADRRSSTSMARPERARRPLPRSSLWHRSQALRSQSAKLLRHQRLSPQHRPRRRLTAKPPPRSRRWLAAAAPRPQQRRHPAAPCSLLRPTERVRRRSLLLEPLPQSGQALALRRHLLVRKLERERSRQPKAAAQPRLRRVLRPALSHLLPAVRQPWLKPLVTPAPRWWSPSTGLLRRQRRPPRRLLQQRPPRRPRRHLRRLLPPFWPLLPRTQHRRHRLRLRQSLGAAA